MWGKFKAWYSRRHWIWKALIWAAAPLVAVLVALVYLGGLAPSQRPQEAQTEHLDSYIEEVTSRRVEAEQETDESLHRLREIEVKAGRAREEVAKVNTDLPGAKARLEEIRRRYGL